VVLAFLAVAVACEEPTQVTVRITSSVQCENLSDVHTFIGPNPEATQSRFQGEVSVGASDRCDPDGFIGTLVVTPGGDSGSILVAVGVRGGDGTPPPQATKCADPEVAKRCIVARRTFTFIENKPLLLPIDLDPLCVGQSCDPASTCFKGSCVSANVVCVGADCGLPQENPGGIPTGEGGAGDATSSDGAYDADLDALGSADVNDSGAIDGDAMSGTDAQLDALIDSGNHPACGFASFHYCAGPAAGTVTPGLCDGTSASVYCCKCRCPSGTIAMCQMMMETSSCGTGTICMP
jgi:hypothetical protein